MQALGTVAIVFQDSSTLIQDVHSIMFAQWLMAICILIVLLALIGAALAAYLAVRGLQKKINQLSKEAQGRARPLIAQGQDILGKVQEVVADLKPKIASVTTDVTHMTGVVKGEVDHISGVVKEQVDHISAIVTAKADEIGTTVTKLNGTVQELNGTVQDVNGKTQAQVQRVNGMVSEALTTTENVSRSIQQGIKAPVIKVAGWVAAAKSGIEGLSEKIPFFSHLMESKSESVPTTPVAKDAGAEKPPQPRIPKDFPNKPMF